LVGRPEGKRPLGRPRRKWEDNIKMDLREIRIDGANWIQLAQDRVQWRVSVNTVMKLRFPQRTGFYDKLSKYKRFSKDSSVGIALCYGLDDRGSRFRFPAGAENFSLNHRVQNGSGTHPASCPMGSRGSFPGGTAAGA
jgi:hypothetical protein